MRSHNAIRLDMKDLSEAIKSTVKLVRPCGCLTRDALMPPLQAHRMAAFLRVPDRMLCMTPKGHIFTELDCKKASQQGGPRQGPTHLGLPSPRLGRCSFVVLGAISLVSLLAMIRHTPPKLLRTSAACMTACPHVHASQLEGGKALQPWMATNMQTFWAKFVTMVEKVRQGNPHLTKPTAVRVAVCIGYACACGVPIIPACHCPSCIT